MHTLWISLRLTAALTLVLGLAYPALVTLLAQSLVPGPANGSLILNGDDTVVGSSLIGQNWSGSSRWFQGRPSATGGSPYNPLASGGSNLSPVGRAYRDRVAAAEQEWETRAQAAGQNAPVPPALLTASASGLDPHLDLQAALWQVPLVAAVRGADADTMAALVQSMAVHPGWPWEPEPLVNLLNLNRALDAAFPGL